jgi:hypothetical protein
MTNDRVAWASSTGNLEVFVIILPAPGSRLDVVWDQSFLAGSQHPNMCLSGPWTVILSPPRPHCWGYRCVSLPPACSFEIGSHSLLAELASNHSPSISTSCIVGIIGMYHHAQHKSF